MATYIKKPIRMTSAELCKRFAGSHLNPGVPEDLDRFPVWVWPYICRAYLAGKLNEDFTVPKNADIDDYPLPVLGFCKNAGIEFPGVKLAELPDGYFTLVKDAISSKKMDQYGNVDPENLHDIPVPLLPYVRYKGRLGTVLAHVGKLDPEKPTRLPPGLWPYVELFKRKGVVIANK